MIPTGVSGIDEMLGGGIPAGSRVLYSMEPGVDGQLFTISALQEALCRGRSCLVIIPHTTVDAFLHDAAAIRGAPLDIASGRCAFIDAVDRERIRKCSRSSDQRAKDWKARIKKLCTENNTDIIFCYFDMIYEDFGLEPGIAIIDSFKGAEGKKKPTVILEHLNLEGDSTVDAFIGQLKFDVVVTVHAAPAPLLHFNYFTLVHTSWSPAFGRSVPFMTKDGRIIPYIPKIIVTGPPGSGKSTFVTSTSDERHSIDRTGLFGDATTVAMDLGLLHGRVFDVSLFGTPGQPRFDPLLPGLLKHTMGVVLVIDATRPDQLLRANELLDMIAPCRVPVVVAANKNDLPGAMTEQEIRNTLRIRPDTPVFFISSLRREEARFVLDSLVESITRGSC